MEQNSQFKHNEYFPGVYHITDSMDVQFTLMVREENPAAVLFDAGYGLFDPRPYILDLLKKHGLDLTALRVVVSHAHHDHLPGVRWFPFFHIHQDEIPVLEVYTREQFRHRVLVQAKEKKIIPADFNENEFLHNDYRDRALCKLPVIPGIDFLSVPGHTPGSLMMYIESYKLLLTGDDWNPTTWLFFPEALPVASYADNMRNLLSLDFEQALCSHSKELIPGIRLRNYINGLTPEVFAHAAPAETPYPEIKTMRCHPEPETNLIFRYNG
jgi:glyoxylase-like metal-dependent hydrolase (beta-lactamase superfamily II)